MKLKALLKTLLITSCALSASAFAASPNITGAGSTFIYPVLAKWTQTYEDQTKVKIDYQEIGSGGGIQQLTNKTIDFAASDMPLSLSQLTKNHWVQFPMVIGGIVPVVNLKGIAPNQLTLSGTVLADIYLGQIKYWNNPKIEKLNPTVKLPHSLIVTVHRADGSGTTFNFTHYLSSVSPAWKTKVGSETLVQWPGFGLGAKGNSGVAAQVMNLPNSIGYVEYAYAVQNHLVSTKLVNSAGTTVAPSGASFAAAAASANWQAANGFDLVLTNQPGLHSWPIVATTFILMPKKGSNTQVILTFFKWVYAHGSAAASQLDYVSIPSSVSSVIEAQWPAVFKGK